MKRVSLPIFIQTLLLLFLPTTLLSQVNDYSPFVNPFIGTSNYGTTNPGAQVPHGLMNITPFNVMGGDSINTFEKDKQWWSTPYSYENSYLTGFSQVNLSGVGCPELGSLLLMPTTGQLQFDPSKYGSIISNQKASLGIYSTYLDKYGIKVNVTATERTSISEYYYPDKDGNLLLNLGEGLTNESGALAKFVDSQTVTGSKLLGTFCYHPEAVFRIYFALRVDHKPISYGFYKKQREMGVEAQWEEYAGAYKPYEGFSQEMSGDNIGVYFKFTEANEDNLKLTVRVGVSMVSEQEALDNLVHEQENFTLTFSQCVADARNKWNRELSKIAVKGGSQEDKIVFYTALYHTLIHPNISNDVSGSYNEMETLKVNKLSSLDKKRYTVFSLWDTFRTVHPLYCILDPEKQLDMINTMLSMYKENGYLPKWELYSRETFTMNGDPAAIVINDTWQRGIRDFDTSLALEAMKRSAFDISDQNLVRPNMRFYVADGYVPLQEKNDNCVSQTLEYYLADYNVAMFAKSLGDNATYRTLLNRAKKYNTIFSHEYKCFRPRTLSGDFLTPFSPTAGKNFSDNPGFHEGCAWNYAFYIPFDIKGLSKLMGGTKSFVNQLNETFEMGHYDMANEPDIDNAYLFSYFPKYAYRTQELVPELLDQYFKNKPAGLPGNDDTGTMSAWAIFSMMGFYPVSAGTPIYALTTPQFDEIEIKLNSKFYKHNSLTIKTIKENSSAKYIKSILLDGKPYRTGYIISHKDLFDAKEITFILQDKPKRN